MNHKPKYNPQIHHRRSIRLKGYDYSQAGLYFITICCENRKCRFGKIVAGASLADARMELNEYGQIAYDEWAKLPERFSNFELDVFQIMPNHMHGIIVLNNVGAGFTPAQNAGFTPAQNAGFTPAQNAGFTPAQNAGFTPAQNAGFTPAQNDDDNIGQPQINEGQPPINIGQPQINDGQPQGFAPTIGDIVGAYKSLVANACLDIWKLKWAGVNPAPTMGKLWQRNYYEHIIRNEKSYQNISQYIINNPSNWKEDKFFK